MLCRGPYRTVESVKRELPESGPVSSGKEPDAERDARAIALRLLAAMPRSRRQLSESMIRRGVQEDVVTQVLDRLAEVGLVDDVAYARAFVSSRRESRGLARPALAVELRRNGVDDDVVREVLQCVSDDDEETSARALLARIWRDGSGVDTAVMARRAAGRLARRGYAPSLVSRLVREMVEHRGAASGGDRWDLDVE
jgi:regulatory protein